MTFSKSSISSDLEMELNSPVSSVPSLNSSSDIESINPEIQNSLDHSTNVNNTSSNSDSSDSSDSSASFTANFPPIDRYVNCVTRELYSNENPINTLIDLNNETIEVNETILPQFPPKSYSLAHIPTPIDKVSIPGKPTIWIKRDDLTGIGCSGNKIRKLNYLLWEAINNFNATDVITCGGLQSNHCRATAVAARILGVTPHLMLRVGSTAEFAQTATGNFLLDKLMGASIHPISPEAYSNFFTRQKAMERLKTSIETNPERKAYIIGEGGSSQLGSFGYIECFAEILKYSHYSLDGAKFSKIVVSCGSGGTLAGLLLGQALTKTHDIEIIAVAVSDDEHYWRQIVSNIFKDFNDTWSHLLPQKLKEPIYRVVTEYQGPGYGLTTTKQTEFMKKFIRSTGIFLDPSYTGKALLALYDLVEKGTFFDPEDSICFIHTGGIFGLMGNAPALEQLLYA